MVTRQIFRRLLRRFLIKPVAARLGAMAGNASSTVQARLRRPRAATGMSRATLSGHMVAHHTGKRLVDASVPASTPLAETLDLGVRQRNVGLVSARAPLAWRRQRSDCPLVKT